MPFKYFKVLSILILIISISCDPAGQIDDGDPANLIVEITLNEENSGLCYISAYADNSVEYQLYINSSEQAIETNQTGIFEYSFDKTGYHTIEIRAVGSSGRYIKETRQIEISLDSGITLADGYISATNYSGYKLVWNDEFDGNSVNLENWKYEIGSGCPNCGWGNNELQYYRQENTSVKDGVLNIKAKREHFQSFDYTSARLKTQDLMSFKYGRVDIRALLPVGQGIWPALWMLGNDIKTAGWPQCGEIDIMEMVGGINRENTIHGTAHWDNDGYHAQAGDSSTLQEGVYADEYHVFSIIWDELSINWYMNDIKYYTLDISPSQMSEFHQNFFFIFNVAVGGDWPGLPDGSTILPQTMKVDYIRVFQKD